MALNKLTKRAQIGLIGSKGIVPVSNSYMQQNSPTPRGQGVGSVPVLFSLRNVQPNIVSGIANSNSKTTNTAKPPDPESAMVSADPATGIPAAILKPVHPTSKNNRPFNVVVALLILALCLLVIRNSQGTKPISKGEVVSSGMPTNPTPSKEAANPKLDSVSPSIAKANEHKPLELGSPTVSAPVFATSHSTTSQSNSSVFPTQSEPIPETSTVGESNIVKKSKDNEQLFVQAQPSIPSLLSNSKQESLDEIYPTSGNSATGNLEIAKTQSQSGTSFPEPRMAMKQGSPDMKADTRSQTQPTIDASAQAIADTHSHLTTKDLYSLYERRKQTSPSSSALNGSAPSDNSSRSVPTTNISHVYPVVGNSSNVMTGQPYPALSKDYVPLPISANEQTQIDSHQGFAGPTQASAIKNGNRYQYISQPQQIPYTPIATPQIGNSVGYPPGS